MRNTENRYGLSAIVLHWSVAIFIIGLFVLGTYMVDLDYYHPWYKQAPDLHRSFGIIVAALLLIRWLWRLSNLRPHETGEPWERVFAKWLHRFFYLLITAIVISGYLITTAEGQPISVFNWFKIPATITSIDNQEDIAGEVHQWLTTTLIVLATLHASAALKHHFINRDSSLRRMLGKTESPVVKNPSTPPSKRRNKSS